MLKDAFRKGLVFGITVLFVGAGVTPSTNGNCEKQENKLIIEKKLNFAPSDENLVGYWNFNEGSDATAHDYAGSHHGTIYGSAEWTTDTPSGNGYALVFDGVDDYVNIPDVDDFRFQDQDVSISIWVQITDNVNLYRWFLDLGDTDGRPRLVMVKLRSGASEGRIHFSVDASEPTSSTVNSIETGDALPKNTWIHLVGVIDTAYSEVKLYLDNELQGTDSLIDYNLNNASTLRFRIGKCNHPPGGLGEFHKGKIDEVRIYNKTLNEDEIENLYNNPAGNEFPNADFSWTPREPETAETIIFNASSSNDPDGDIVLYEWDWDNDGTYDENHTTPTATQSWPVEGSYNVTLRVTDNNDTSDEIIKQVFVSVGNIPPVADFTWDPQKPIATQNVTFDASSSYDPDGVITLYEWDWDDDGNYDESHPTPTATNSWDEPYSYNITLRVTDNNDTVNIETRTITILQRPNAGFTWTPQEPKPGETIMFNASSSNDPDGDIVLYEWDWDNDGYYDENNNVSNATHNWSEPGVYPVNLRVTDNDGLADNVTKLVYVGVGIPCVEGIGGGFGIDIYIRNIGNQTAYNVSWSIDIDNAWIILRGEYAEDVIDELGAGESETVRHSSLFAIGKDVLITVSAGSDVKNTTASWVIGPLVLGVP
jgi:PKD repeat protein